MLKFVKGVSQFPLVSKYTWAKHFIETVDVIRIKLPMMNKLGNQSCISCNSTCIIVLIEIAHSFLSLVLRLNERSNAS